MTLHRSTSSTFSSTSSSSHPSTLLLHPLDIHFLAEPYGLPHPGPTHPPLPPPTSTPSTLPPPTSTPSTLPPPTSTPSTLPPPTSTPSTLPPSSTPLSLGFPRDPPKPPKAPLTTPAAHINTQSYVNTRTRPSTVAGATHDASSLPTTPHAHASSLPTTPYAHASSLPTTPTTPPAHARSLPKVQVCGRGGVWWALNAGVLFLYRQLYDQGLCSCIKAEVVPLHKVPGPLQTAMILDGEDVDETRSLLPDSSRTTKRGYDRLTTTEDDANGNASPALRRDAPRGSSAPSSAATTPTTTADVTTPSSDLEVASTGSASVVESSSSEYDHYMSQSDEDDEDEDEDDDDDDDDDDEALTCNVCDRAFPTSRLLTSHQTRKRHYGCSTCENVFPTLMSLEAHKEETNHWSDHDLFLDDEDDEDDDDLDEFYDDDENEEEREKLL